MSTRIAFPTEDGETISRHFGQARYFKIITIIDGRVGDSELREKASHQHGEHDHADGMHPGQKMVDAISDCQVLISGGMGMPAVERASAKGLQVFLTRRTSIAEAAQAFVDGTLEHEPKLIHQHH